MNTPFFLRGIAYYRFGIGTRNTQVPSLLLVDVDRSLARPPSHASGKRYAVRPDPFIFDHRAVLLPQDALVVRSVALVLIQRCDDHVHRQPSALLRLAQIPPAAAALGLGLVCFTHCFAFKSVLTAF